MASIRERYLNRAAMDAAEVDGREMEIIRSNLEDMRTNAKRYLDRLDALATKHAADTETVADVAGLKAAAANWIDPSKLPPAVIPPP